MLDLYYGYWDYWNFYHKVTFDGPNKLILINPGVTNLSVKEDIYSNWKEWFMGHDGVVTAKYIEAAEAVGGQPLPGGTYLGDTYFLINGWKIKPYPGSYSLSIDGNIYTNTGEDYFTDAEVTTIPNNIRILNTVSNIVQTDEVEVPALTTAQITLIVESVWNKLLAEHGLPGTTGEALQKIKNNAALIPATV